MLYVCVTDVAASAKKAKANGATIVMGPVDVMDHGRMAVIKDPQGAVVSLWEPKKHIGARIINTIGTLCWAELATKDTAAAASFYTSLFGWKTDTKKAGPPGMQSDYTEWVAGGGAHIGGMLEMTEEWGDAPPNWMPYFQVTDCTETVDKVKKLGGKVEFGPLPIENVGHFALISDPQGAYFSVVEMNLVA
jgi:predicted enzyme related to lactoylglutathione lyase